MLDCGFLTPNALRCFNNQPTNCSDQHICLKDYVPQAYNQEKMSTSTSTSASIAQPPASNMEAIFGLFDHPKTPASKEESDNARAELHRILGSPPGECFKQTPRNDVQHTVSTPVSEWNGEDGSAPLPTMPSKQTLPFQVTQLMTISMMMNVFSLIKSPDANKHFKNGINLLAYIFSCQVSTEKDIRDSGDDLVAQLLTCFKVYQIQVPHAAVQQLFSSPVDTCSTEHDKIVFGDFNIAESVAESALSEPQKPHAQQGTNNCFNPEEYVFNLLNTSSEQKITKAKLFIGLNPVDNTALKNWLSVNTETVEIFRHPVTKHPWVRYRKVVQCDNTAPVVSLETPDVSVETPVTTNEQNVQSHLDNEIEPKKSTVQSATKPNLSDEDFDTILNFILATLAEKGPMPSSALGLSLPEEHRMKGIMKLFWQKCIARDLSSISILDETQKHPVYCLPEHKKELEKSITNAHVQELWYKAIIDIWGPKGGPSERQIRSVIETTKNFAEFYKEVIKRWSPKKTVVSLRRHSDIQMRRKEKLQHLYTAMTQSFDTMDSDAPTQDSPTSNSEPSCCQMPTSSQETAKHWTTVKSRTSKRAEKSEASCWYNLQDCTQCGRKDCKISKEFTGNFPVCTSCFEKQA